MRSMTLNNRYTKTSDHSSVINMPIKEVNTIKNPKIAINDIEFGKY